MRVQVAQPRPVGYLSRLVAESRSHAQSAIAAGELQTSLNRLLQRAEIEEWSQRELSRRAGIPETTFRRLRDGKAKPIKWLPKLQTALARLNPS